jgi:GDPmannose 4,6-dehydratase
MRKRALICGVSGQDGAYLANLLLSKDYEVLGTSRDAQSVTFSALTNLKIREEVTLRSMAVNDFRSVLQTIVKTCPDEVYNLAGQSSVGLSFEQPVETMESISIGTLNLLEAIRFTGRSIKFYSACSSECFGDTNGYAADEETPFRPRSPYAVAKAAAHWQVANYREAYDLFACSGILFNHESPLRPERFVTQKVVSTACRIARGSRETLHLGNISVVRDWGWAPEYVEAMWLMLQASKPEDFVIATGTSTSLETFVATAFRLVGLDWHDHVVVDQNLLRPTDLAIGRANPAKANKILGWTASMQICQVIEAMIQSYMEKNSFVTTL